MSLEDCMRRSDLLFLVSPVGRVGCLFVENLSKSLAVDIDVGS
jgi:hypothetical protein